MKQLRIPFLLFLFCLILCYLLWFVPRENFEQSLLAFVTLSMLMVMIGISTKKTHLLLQFGIIARITAIFAFPVLSDDIYRFIWDGLLISNGLNVYQYTPIELVTSGVSGMVGNANHVYPFLNSKEYFTVYPPITQSINLFAVWVSNGDVYWSAIIIKLFLALADIGTLLLIRLILINNNNLNSINLSLYALNPVPILEFAGNGHHEALVIFGLVSSIYFWRKRHFSLSGAFTGFAISVKLLPMIFVPVFLMQKISVKEKARWLISVSIVSFLFLFPLFNSISINAMTSSIGLYFEIFSFNSPLYSILNWLSGFSFEPWKIQSLANYFPYISIVGILVTCLIIYLKQTDLVLGLILVLTVYLITSRVIHPWYITPLLAFGVIRNNHPILIWPMVSFLSYSLYASKSFEENPWMISIEYIVLLAALIYSLANRSSANRNIEKLK